MLRKETFYEKYIKRFLDVCGALLALIIVNTLKSLKK